MNALFKLSINSLCISCFFTQQINDADQFSDIISSLQSYDKQDGNYLIQINKKRVAAQLNPIEYDAGLIKMASKISFDMAQENDFFTPEIDEKETMSISGCAYKISTETSKNSYD